MSLLSTLSRSATINKVNLRIISVFLRRMIKNEKQSYPSKMCDFIKIERDMIKYHKRTGLSVRYLGTKY